MFGESMLLFKLALYSGNSKIAKQYPLLMLFIGKIAKTKFEDIDFFVSLFHAVLPFGLNFRRAYIFQQGWLVLKKGLVHSGWARPSQSVFKYNPKCVLQNLFFNFYVSWTAAYVASDAWFRVKLNEVGKAHSWSKSQYRVIKIIKRMRQF